MSPASPIPQEDSFDLLTSNESCKLSGITAGRAKPPKRRPPSSHFLKENVRFIENKKIGKNYIFLRKFCKKLHNLSENMAKIDALFTKSLTFLRFILNLPPPPFPKI